MSIIRILKGRPGDGQWKPALVVSRNAINQVSLPPKAAPAQSSSSQPHLGFAEPVSRTVHNDNGLPEHPFSTPAGAYQRFPKRFTTRSSSMALPMSVCSPEESAAKRQQLLKNSTLWKYLLMYMPPDTPMPKTSLVLDLLVLPRRRELPHWWKAQLLGGYPDVKVLCALLVYLSGVKAESPCRHCANTSKVEVISPTSSANGKVRDFPECVTLPPSASPEMKAFFGPSRCCNRFYASPLAMDANGLGESRRASSGSVAPSTPPSPGGRKVGRRRSSSPSPVSNQRKKLRSKSVYSLSSSGDSSVGDSIFRPLSGPDAASPPVTAPSDKGRMEVAATRASTTQQPARLKTEQHLLLDEGEEKKQQVNNRILIHPQYISEMLANSGGRDKLDSSPPPPVHSQSGRDPAGDSHGTDRPQNQTSESTAPFKQPTGLTCRYGAFLSPSVMADWEMAPGRIKTASEATTADSKSQLCSPF